MLEQLSQELASLETQALRRRLQALEEVLPGGKVRLAGKVLLNLSSNDYLGLSLDPRLIARGPGSRSPLGDGSRGLPAGGGPPGLAPGCGDAAGGLQRDPGRGDLQHRLHGQPGSDRSPDRPGDAVFCDRLNHASIYDGVKLSGATLHRFPHRDLNRLEELLQQGQGARRRLIITDSVFSVDGDLAPLAELVALKERFGAALMIDEAHATGVLEGRAPAWRKPWA